jgi:hypothetical protein
LTRGTLLEDLYPVTVTDRWDFMPGGTFTPAQPLPSGCLNYRGEAGSYWIHRVTARDGAKVVLRVRDTPVLTYQQVGRGCVVIFSGAALEGPRRLKAYWEDGAWKSWLAEFLAGLG